VKLVACEGHKRIWIRIFAERLKKIINKKNNDAQRLITGNVLN